MTTLEIANQVGAMRARQRQPICRDCGHEQLAHYGERGFGGCTDRHADYADSYADISCQCDGYMPKETQSVFDPSQYERTASYLLGQTLSAVCQNNDRQLHAYYQDGLRTLDNLNAECVCQCGWSGLWSDLVTNSGNDADTGDCPVCESKFIEEIER